MTKLEIVFDAKVPYDLAHFWAQALEGYTVRRYDEAEIARLATLGLTPQTDPTVPIDGAGPTIWFQKSDSVTTSRNRVHLDVRVPERRDAVNRLRQLGATIRDEHDGYTVLLDPEGNQFCIVGAAGAGGSDDEQHRQSP